MAPHTISIVLISGQANSGELVLAASAFLSSVTEFLYIVPVSTSKSIREEFYLSLDAFRIRECLYPLQPNYVAPKIVEPHDGTATGLFWLALDNQGASIAREFFSANGESSEEIVYQSVRKVNLIEQTISSPPEIVTSSEFWSQIINELNRVSWEHRKVKSKKGRQALFDKYVPMTSKEKVYYLWHKSLYESLMPWARNIDNIQIWQS